MGLEIDPLTGAMKFDVLKQEDRNDALKYIVVRHYLDLAEKQETILIKDVRSIILTEMEKSPCQFSDQELLDVFPRMCAEGFLELVVTTLHPGDIQIVSTKRMDDYISKIAADALMQLWGADKEYRYN